MTPRLFIAPFLNPLTRERADWEPEGAIAVDAEGKILSAGPRGALQERYSSLPIEDCASEILLPAFVDLHSHLPQWRCRGRSVADERENGLLEWLTGIVYPEEARFADPEYAAEVAAEYFRELIRQGIATAAVYASSFLPAARIAFEQAARSGLRIVMGRTLMDRNVPGQLLLDTREALRGTERLIEEWHGKNGLLHYAVTPRFAASCSADLLEGCARLAERHGTYTQTHLNESIKEIRWVRELFPDAGSYTEIYDRAGLLSHTSILAHNIHATDGELRLCALRDAAVAHCPDSNLVLGSGRFPLEKYRDLPLRVGLASDVGAGRTLSMFHTMRAASEVQGRDLDPFLLLHLVTLGGAAALSLDRETGSFEAGKYFDAVALSREALTAGGDPAQAGGAAIASAIVSAGDERIVRRLFVRGREIAY